MPGFLLAGDHSLSMVSSCAAKHRCAPVLARISSGVTPGAIAVTVRQPGLQSMMHSSVTIVFTQPGAVSGSEHSYVRFPRFFYAGALVFLHIIHILHNHKRNLKGNRILKYTQV